MSPCININNVAIKLTPEYLLSRKTLSFNPIWVIMDDSLATNLLKLNSENVNNTYIKTKINTHHSIEIYSFLYSSSKEIFRPHFLISIMNFF